MNALALTLPFLPYMYMHALAIWLFASQTVYSPTPAFSSCAPQLFKQVTDHLGLCKVWRCTLLVNELW